VTVDGFFAGPNGTSAPSAAGLAYAIDMSWSKPYDIIGVAGFGLGSFGPSTAAPVAPTAVATGTYIAVADTFYDGSSNNGTGWDLIIDGSTNVATEIGNSVNSFSGSNSQPQCTSSCTFTAGTATQLESGDSKFLDVENALIGASWVRWSTGHEFTHNFDDPNIGHAHLIKLVAPASPLPTSGVGTYTVFGGGTTPTLSSGPGEANTVTATGPSTHTITVNFDYGAMTATHEIPFPTTTVSVFGSVQSGPVSMQNSIHFSGDLIGGPNACTSCVFGHDHFTFAESNAKYVVGSGQFNTSGLSPYEVSGGFTFILGDPAR
jgi:hypothetical protein